MTAKLNVWADNHEISDRALTNIIIGASAVDQGVDIDECAVTVMSTNRKRKKTLRHPTASQNSFHPKSFFAYSLPSLGQGDFDFQTLGIVSCYRTKLFALEEAENDYQTLKMKIGALAPTYS